MSALISILKPLGKVFQALGGNEPGGFGVLLRMGLCYLASFVLIFAGWIAYERVEWEIFRMKNKEVIVEARALVEAKTGGKHPYWMDKEEREARGDYDYEEWENQVVPAWYMVEKYDNSPHNFSSTKSAAGGLSILGAALGLFIWDGRLRRRKWAEEDEMLHRYRLEQNRRG